MNTIDITEAIKPVIHEEEGRYWAEIPAMPGCFSVGDTLEEVHANIIEAAQCWIQAKLDWIMGHVSPATPLQPMKAAFA